MIQSLETPRLVLRPLCLDDAPAIQRIFPEWEIVKFMLTAIPWPYPPDGALHFIRDVALPGMVAGEAWHWSIRLRDQPQPLIGLLSLKDEPDNHRGFWLGLDFQGQGFMREAADAATDYWFKVLEKPVLRVRKAVPNTASRRISERQGMRLVETREQDYIGGRFPAELWEISRADWLARSSIRD